jgi:type IV pilus assembly protein PilY1
MITLTGIKKNIVTLGMGMLLAAIGQPNAHAATLSLPDVPLFVLNTVDPNVLMTVDDSGSMAWAYVPDGISGLSGNNRGCSTTINGVYYDPTTTYTPPTDALGNTYPDANFGADGGSATVGAWIDGYYATTGSSAGTQVNLATSYQPSWSNLTSYAACGTAMAAAPNYGGAFYYAYNSTCLLVGGINNDGCYTLVRHSAGSPWSAAQKTNFANWYSYYRTRNLTIKSTVSRAFGNVGSNVRVAYQHLNTCNTAFGGALTAACPGTYVRPLGGTARSDFFTWLFRTPTNNTTPLVQAADRARAYLLTSNATSPWAENPGTAVGTEYSCRQNFHMMFTDGYWNGGSVGTNIDNAAATLPDGVSYSPGALPANRKIYPDSNTGYLGDVAFNAWKTDARPDLNNNVPRYLSTVSLANPDDITLPANVQHYWNPDNDPANWQHLVTFTVGLGIDGLLNPADYFDRTLLTGDYHNLLAGTANWNAGDQVDDLWHAAINGRGEYFSAKNPTNLVNAFTKVLNTIATRTGSAASLSANGSTTAGGTAIYQVSFNTSLWGGRLLARTIDVNGSPVSTLWEAGASGLNTQNYDTGRQILTYNPAVPGGVPFRWASLSAAQQAALNTNPVLATDANGAARLDYLRGASANEGAGLNFRTRTCFDISGAVLTTCPANVGKLGDIIDSGVSYVGKPPFGYPDTLESVTYKSFRTAQTGRTPMVYVGANDGMLHGFRADTGLEKIAYVPNSVYTNDGANNLSLLTWSSYTHRYYVDGTPTAGDAYYSGAWHSILVGGLRKGGRGYYALDVTNPSAFSEANAANIVRWEYTDTDLGYSYSPAAIVKVSSSTGTAGAVGKKGRWAAVFGNGYNNTGTGHAVLYVVDIETGTLIKKIDTSISGGGGSVATPNGLATPAVIDIDDDNVADYVYAGDLQGNMWRFDIRSGTPSDWALTTNVTRLFTARDAVNNNVQPITERPSVGFHPFGFGGLMVYFGTGKYLESSDNTTSGTPQTQSFYGIYDRGVTPSPTEASAQETVLRSDLLVQTIGSNVTVGSFNTRGISNNPINYRLSRTALPNTYLGWVADLPTAGEKQVTDPVLREGRIIFTSLIPSTDPCTPGGTGWLMELNTENGGQLTNTFDLNSDGNFNASDRITVGGQSTGAAGIQPTTGGAMSAPIVLAVPQTSRPPAAGTAACKEYKLSQATDGSIVKIAETCRAGGREAWRQVK